MESLLLHGLAWGATVVFNNCIDGIGASGGFIVFDETTEAK
jgi:hypothetical protein